MKPGTLIAGRYRIVRRLARGGMAEVFEVVDTALDRPRALKLTYAHAADDPEARARFELEARIGSRIESAALVEVTDTGVDPDSDRLFLVMELLAGENLGERLDRLGARPAAEVVEHLAQLGIALGRVHARGVVHRDLTPSNVFLHEPPGEPARIKLLDLGIARRVGPRAAATTGVTGTPAYMAPEQLRGRGVGTATDLYALGLLAFTLLVGRTYWTEASALDPVGFGLVAVQGPPEPASVRARAAGVTLPAGFDDWFARATARVPDQRFPSALAAVAALGAALGVDLPAALQDAITAAPDTTAAASACAGLPVDGPAGATAAAGGTEAATSAGPRAADRGARRWRARALVAGVVVGVACAAWQLAPWAGPASPLGERDAVLACPMLDTEGAPAQGAWLGAAAAAMACERARAVLGGLPARTRVPAELLALAAVEDPDADPFAQPEARARSLAEARRRGQAYLDGEVAHGAAGFRVRLVLRRPDGDPLARGEAEAAGLVEAVRGAMQPMLDAAAIPTRAPDPVVADYARAADAATLVRLTDLKLAFVANAGGLEAECAGLAAAPTDLAPFLRYVCRYQLGEAPPEVVPPAPTSPGALTAWVRVEHMLGHDLAAARAALEAHYQAATSAWARSTLAATLSCLVFASAPREALAWAQAAVDDEPKNPTGEWCGGWGQLMSIADGSSIQRRVAARWQVWAPWESYAWWYSARTAGSPEKARAFAARAYALSPFDTNLASDLAERQIRGGHSADAGAIAQRLATSHHPVHQRTSALLLIRFDLSEARFGAALAAARDELRPQPGDAGWTRTLRLIAAVQAVTAAAVIGRGREVADETIGALIDGAELGFDGSSEDERRQIAAICAHGSAAAAARCFARIVAPARLRGGSSEETRALIDGARRFAAGAPAAAALAWRPLVRDAGAAVGLLADAMVTAFAAAGDPILAIDVGLRSAADRALWGGATLAMARAAQVAQARGDAALATRLARQVVAAWRLADVRPPILAALEEMAR